MSGHDGYSFFSRAYWTEVGVISRWQLMAVYLLIIGVMLAGFVDSAKRREDLKEQSRDTAVRLEAQTRMAAADIKRSRRAAVVATCREQNARRDAALAVLYRQIRDNAARANAQGLIVALAPAQDCQARAQRLVP
jgi:hypothetical protein